MPNARPDAEAFVTVARGGNTATVPMVQVGDESPELPRQPKVVQYVEHEVVSK